MIIYRSLSVLLFMGVMFFYSCDLNAPRKLKDQKVTGWAIDDQGDSVYMRYDETGKLNSYSTYKNGIKNGIAKKFYDNGNVEFEINYKNGLKEGLTRWFYKSGKLYRETIYENDEETGIQKKYYENEKLMAEIPYEHGRILPGLKEYTTSGKLKTIYPDLIIEPINRLAFENKYILRCYLEGKPKGTDYFRVMRIPGSKMDALIQLDEMGGAGQIEFFLRPGDFIMEKIIFRAEYKTALRNTYVVEKEYNLALDY